MTGRDEAGVTSGWIAQLRVQLLSVTRRRVPADEAEDLVQDALRIITERGLQATAEGWIADDEIDGMPPVAWCLQVLRNVIGNHYRRAQTRRKYLDPGVNPVTATPVLEALDGGDRSRIIEDGLDELATSDPNCGHYLRRLADEAAVQEIAAETGLAINALYQRLYRCRRKLREILRRRGVLP